MSQDDEWAPLLNPLDVAEWLGVSAAWVKDHATRKHPRIPTVKVGKLLRFRRVDVRDFIRACSSLGKSSGETGLGDCARRHSNW